MMTRYSASGHVSVAAALLEDDHERGGSDTRARVAAELREVEAYLNTLNENDELRAALLVIEDILEFHEGSEKLIREGGEPVIWINASSSDGDFQRMLDATHNALHRT